uniref:Uncharacterized protein n=3 Tax=Klebsiella/Raoultella group TaxID=2890311 RepID=A0A2L1K837_KLEPN|nr:MULTISPECIES: hypothetical protein [Klebsiella/Raoultella group]AGO89108.1 hypothetical protein pKpNDM1_00259 [Raoultella planticola]AVE18234.1 Hypothetical protein [Klebsiella pneumoniae]AVE18539.1 Hypothetical protein [Klebsiella pneumoniae]AVE18873.1 Hypothetical protein [Klebsiella pneumoniae]AVE19301.1 Hypothetical protein [Klebsiella pneumoniae]
MADRTYPILSLVLMQVAHVMYCFLKEVMKAIRGKVTFAHTGSHPAHYLKELTQ